MKEADYICVLDTGSTDKTRKRLKKLGVNVKKKIISPWRFDEARNVSLKLIPDDADICVCTDLDEVFNEGWADELRNIWQDDTTRARYIYNWSIDENNNPIISFYYEKIHRKENYKWIYPVHEVLETSETEKYVTTDKIILNHYPDRSKSRSSYLPLLKLANKENPDNDRILHYLGREYMYYRKWNKAIDTLIKHLALPTATWLDERCASMRFIARCYVHLNRYDEANMWLDKAIKEAPHLRDPLVEKALLSYDLQDYKSVHKYSLLALRIKNHEKSYINEPFSWDHTLYDLLSLSSYYYKNNPKLAIKYINKALKNSPGNARLLNNKKFFHSILKE